MNSKLKIPHRDVLIVTVFRCRGNIHRPWVILAVAVGHKIIFQLISCVRPCLYGLQLLPRRLLGDSEDQGMKKNSPQNAERALQDVIWCNGTFVESQFIMWSAKAHNYFRICVFSHLCFQSGNSSHPSIPVCGDTALFSQPIVFGL